MAQGNKDINSMNAKELRLEVIRLNEELEMRDEEIQRLTDLIEKFVALELEREDILSMRKRATDALEEAFAEADKIVAEARRVADKIVGRAEESLHACTDEIGVLPGSKELVVSDDLLHGASKSAEKHSFDEYLSRQDENGTGKINNKSWQEVLDSILK